jgi:hypothetical protein
VHQIGDVVRLERHPLVVIGEARRQHVAPRFWSLIRTS